MQMGQDISQPVHPCTSPDSTGCPCCSPTQTGLSSPRFTLLHHAITCRHSRDDRSACRCRSSIVTLSLRCVVPKVLKVYSGSACCLFTSAKGGHSVTIDSEHAECCMWVYAESYHCCCTSNYARHPTSCTIVPATLHCPNTSHI